MVIWYVDEGDVTLATTNYIVFLEPKLIICAWPSHEVNEIDERT